MVVLTKNSIHSVLYLILVLLGLAGHYIVLHAHFLAAVYIIVYAGAIMVLFLYVIMLLDLNKKEDLTKGVFVKFLALGMALSFLSILYYSIGPDRKLNIGSTTITTSSLAYNHPNTSIVTPTLNSNQNKSSEVSLNETSQNTFITNIHNTNSNKENNIKKIALLLFRNYLFPFEISSLVLLVAVMGVVLLSKTTTQNKYNNKGKK